MDVLSTREVIRATTYYNPTIYGSGNGEKNRENITKNIEQYAARKGGYWNYDGLFDLVRAVLSGLSAELARSQLNSLSGPGEAKAKTILFDFLEKEIGLSKNIAVEPEVWRNTLPNGKTTQCRADFAYREKQSNDVIFVFSYPNMEPPL